MSRRGLTDALDVNFVPLVHVEDVLTLVALFTAQTLVASALSVFVVVLALRLYESDPGGVATLEAALGVGGIMSAATVTALGDGVPFSLSPDEFAPAVSGSASSNAAADEVVGARLAALSVRRW